ncbi:MAG: FHIPEP family type III secretion protein, partial [Burkholderiales bacterium]|nr:FHIPEP family type III secretion protein [Burkholderiales bacterium]
IIGGLAVGVLQHGLSLGEAVDNYVLLTVGDGLVAQIPALIISTSAGLVVSRVDTGADLGEQVLSQLFARGHVLNLAAGVLFLLGLIPGMPHVAFISLGIAIAGLAYWLKLRQRQAPQAAVEPEPAPQPETAQEASWDDIVPVDTLGLEVGYRLIPLVDKAQDGELLRRIKAIRKKFAQEIGFLPPAVHIRDNLELKPAGYRITLKGVVIGEAEAFPGQFLAINPGRATTPLPGAPTQDPAFGLPAIWIDATQRDRAVAAGYTVVDASTVVATHLSHLVTQNAAALLGRAELQQLIDHFSRSTPKLLDDLVPKLIPLSTLQKVLQNLLAEGVHIRDLRTIIETLTDHAARTQDASELTSAVRVALGASIVQQIYGSAPELNVIVIEPELEKVLNQALSAEGFGLEPGLAETLLREAGAAVRRQEALGQPAALLVPDRMRPQLSRLLRRALPQLRVLAHAEIPDNRSVRVSTVLGAVPA